MSVSQQIAERRKRKRRSLPDTYNNTNFILGSVAEAERLFSIAATVLSKVRHRMSPIMLEAICFLKINSRYWGLSTVAKAMALNRSDKVEQKLAEAQYKEEELV